MAQVTNNILVETVEVKFLHKTGKEVIKHLTPLQIKNCINNFEDSYVKVSIRNLTTKVTLVIDIHCTTKKFYRLSVINEDTSIFYRRKYIRFYNLRAKYYYELCSLTTDSKFKYKLLSKKGAN